VILSLAVASCILAPVASAYIYWIDAGAGSKLFRRSDLDGTDTADLFTFEMTRAQWLAVDPAAQKVYWADTADDVIYRADLDGTDPELLLEVLDPYGIALDPTRGKMYWTQQSSTGIFRANLDGSSMEEIHSQAIEPQCIAVNTLTQRIYWADSGADAILAADLDGANVDSVATGLGNPIGIAVHETEDWVFWTELGDLTGERVMRVDGDGSNLTELNGPGGVSMFNPRGIAVDPVRDLVFLTSDFIQGRMHRMTVHGGSIEQVITGENYGPIGVAADPTTGYCYWWHSRDRGFYRTDPLVGGKELALVGMITPRGLAHDVAGNRVFWSDGRHILSVGTDGAGFYRVTSDFLGDARSVAYAAVAQKLYWITTANLYRSNPDGSAVEALSPACDIHNPNDVVLDEGSGTIFWTSTQGVIQRSNLDGTGCVDLDIPGVENPFALALEAGGAILYISDYSTHAIFRYDVIADEVTTLVDDVWNVYGLAIAGDKLYWTEVPLHIKRANLADGSQVETVHSDLDSPWGIVTDDGMTPVQRMSWSQLKRHF
jgi:sugar lactone lactonase YvrE